MLCLFAVVVRISAASKFQRGEDIQSDLDRVTENNVQSGKEKCISRHMDGKHKPQNPAIDVNQSYNAFLTYCKHDKTGIYTGPSRCLCAACPEFLEPSPPLDLAEYHTEP